MVNVFPSQLQPRSYVPQTSAAALDQTHRFDVSTLTTGSVNVVHCIEIQVREDVSRQNVSGN